MDSVKLQLNYMKCKSPTNSCCGSGSFLWWSFQLDARCYTKRYTWMHIDRSICICLCIDGSAGIDERSSRSRHPLKKKSLFFSYVFSFFFSTWARATPSLKRLSDSTPIRISRAPFTDVVPPPSLHLLTFRRRQWRKKKRATLFLVLPDLLYTLLDFRSL